MITPEQQSESVLKLMRKLHDDEFWGQVILRFKKGELYMIEPRETIPVEKLVTHMEVCCVETMCY